MGLDFTGKDVAATSGDNGQSGIGERWSCVIYFPLIAVLWIVSLGWDFHVLYGKQAIVLLVIFSIFSATGLFLLCSINPFSQNAAIISKNPREAPL